MTQRSRDSAVAFADHGDTGETLSPSDDDCDEVLANFAEAGINVNALAHISKSKVRNRSSNRGTIC